MAGVQAVGVVKELIEEFGLSGIDSQTKAVMVAIIRAGQDISGAIRDVCREEEAPKKPATPKKRVKLSDLQKQARARR